MTNITVDTDGTTGDYSSLDAALEDLTPLDDDYTITCQATDGDADTQVCICSVDLNNNTLEINGDFASTEWSDTAYRLAPTGQYDTPFSVTFSNGSFGDIVISGLQAKCDYRNAFNFAGVACIVIDCYAIGGDAAESAGFNNEISGTVFVNCIAADCANFGFYNSADTYSYNCVAINCAAAGFQRSNYRYFYLKNCYSGGNGDDDYEVGNVSYASRMVMTTCASSDTTGSTGLQSIAGSTSSGAYFTSVTSGSEDVEIGSSSDLIGEGTDLSSDAYYDFDDDIVGTDRGSTWDIGAFEFVSATTVMVGRLIDGGLVDTGLIGGRLTG